MPINLYRSQVSTKRRLDLDSVCLKTPITTFCLTIVMVLNFSQFFRYQFWVIFPYLKRGQLTSSRHSAEVIIAPETTLWLHQTIIKSSHPFALYINVHLSSEHWGQYNHTIPYQMPDQDIPAHFLQQRDLEILTYMAPLRPYYCIRPASYYHIPFGYPSAAPCLCLFSGIWPARVGGEGTPNSLVLSILRITY